MARKNPFTKRQLSRTVVLWAQHQSITKVRREFQKEFNLAKHPRLVPSMSVFRNASTIARCHTTNLVLEWLQTKFGDRIISGRTQRPWPAKSPCLAPNDYWLWSVCLQEIRRVKPASLEELKEVVNDFCESLDPDEVRKAVRHIRRRAQACFEADGGHFEHNLKKKNYNVEE